MHTTQGWSPLANEGMRSLLDQWQFGRRLGQQRWGNFIRRLSPLTSQSHFREVSCDWAEETQASNSWRSHS
jgi:hypothetical protein